MNKETNMNDDLVEIDGKWYEYARRAIEVSPKPSDLFLWRKGAREGMAMGSSASTYCTTRPKGWWRTPAVPPVYVLSENGGVLAKVVDGRIVEMAQAPFESSHLGIGDQIELPGRWTQLNEDQYMRLRPTEQRAY